MVVSEAKLAARLFLLLAAMWPALAAGQSLPQPQVRLQPENDNSNRAASTSYVDRSVQILLNSIAGKAPLASPVFTGTASFANRPTFGGATPWDSGNLNPSAFAPLANPAFTGTAKADTLQILGSGSTGDISSMSVAPSTAAPANTLSRLIADRAPLASPVFTGAPFAPGMRIAGGVPPSVSYPFAGFANSKTAFLSSVTGQSETGPESAGAFQLVSNGGSTDKFGNFKVALKSVYQALPGAADGWAANFVASSSPDVGDKTGLIGLELNLNNNHFPATGDVSSPYTAGLYITGTGSKTSMAGVLVAGDRPIYRDGLHFEDKSPAGSRTITNATINDQTKSPNILITNTAHTNGVDLVNGTFAGFPFRSPGFSVNGAGDITAPTANLNMVSITGAAGAAMSIAGSHTLGVDLINGTYGAFAFRSPGFTVDGAGGVSITSSLAVSNMNARTDAANFLCIDASGVIFQKATACR